ncbi:MAG: hypothetical protein F4210_12915, partial [Holophagales bacterium]|nr:hypothetical protein [Holophagales bacterium]
MTVQATHRLPFTVSETGAGEESYDFSLDSAAEVSVSLTGMDKDIDCRVNSSSCTNRGGTRDDSWSGTLSAGTHTVSVYPYGGGSGSWTLSVGERTPTSVTPPPPPPQPTCPSGYTYVASASRCERSQSFRMRAIETGVSSQQSYSFTLGTSSSVSVSLTGLTRDFDCRVGSSSCTNNWGSADDSWSGALGAGTHTVVVYPYGGGGPGDYTLTVAVNDVSLVSIAQPFGAPDTEDDETCRLDGEEIECPTPDETLDVVGEDPGTPEEPEGTTPPDTDPPPETPAPGDGGGPPGGGTPSWPEAMMPESLRNAVADAIAKAETCSVYTDRLGNVSAYADLTAARDAGQIVPGRSQPRCVRDDPPPPDAYVNSIPGTTIYICPVFFEAPASEMS